MSFKIQHGQIIPTQGKQNPGQNQVQKPENKAFERTLMEAVQRQQALNQTVKISSHASDRMIQRDITLSDEDLSKINDAVNRLETKGAKESLLLYKDLAFIASIKNKTIITAMSGNEVDTVTNIDSFVKIT